MLFVVYCAVDVTCVCCVCVVCLLVGFSVCLCCLLSTWIVLCMLV